MMRSYDGNGRWRFAGNLSSVAQVREGLGPPPLVPRLKWRGLIEALPAGPDRPHLPPVRDQGHVGQCNPEAACAAVEVCRASQGLPHVELSPADLYGRINQGVDQGSYLEDAMREMLRAGVGTAATSGRLWHRGTPPAPADERSRYRVLECHVCPTFGHVMSAVLSGFAVVSGVPWWARYWPRDDGWMPESGAGPKGAHAMMGYAPAVREDGVYGVWHQNSFGPRWGPLGGRCVLPEHAYRDAVGGWWAVRQAVTEGGDLPPLAARAA